MISRPPLTTGDGVIAAPPDGDCEMIGSMAGCRHEPDVIVEFVVAFDEVGLLGIEDRQHTVGNAGDWIFGVLRGPVRDLLLREDIACIGKCRQPAAVLKARVPADMIDMQVGAHDEIDIGGRDAGRGQAL